MGEEYTIRFQCVYDVSHCKGKYSWHEKESSTHELSLCAEESDDLLEEARDAVRKNLDQLEVDHPGHWFRHAQVALGIYDPSGKLLYDRPVILYGEFRKSVAYALQELGVDSLIVGMLSDVNDESSMLSGFDRALQSIWFWIDSYPEAYADDIKSGCRPCDFFAYCYDSIHDLVVDLLRDSNVTRSEWSTLARRAMELLEERQGEFVLDSPKETALS